MRNFNMLAAISAALLMGAGASARETADQPKPRKICRTVEEPGRIIPRKICRILAPSEDAQRKAGDARETGNDRD
jgi:hypothetical protein